mgnify:CR=1 FL=1
MKNSKLKKFEIKVASLILENKDKIINEVAKHLETFETIEFIKFNYKEPYTGDLKNKIFLTYSNHYRFNSGTSMSIGSLKHPHFFMGDRGYIKGVAIDLESYLKLRSAKMINHTLDIARLYQPKFRKSKNSEIYTNTCHDLIKSAIEIMDNYILDQQKVLNKKLNEMTGCSLLHYIENI